MAQDRDQGDAEERRRRREEAEAASRRARSGSVARYLGDDWVETEPGIFYPLGAALPPTFVRSQPPPPAAEEPPPVPAAPPPPEDEPKRRGWRPRRT